MSQEPPQIQKHPIFLDATPLIHFARIGELNRLGTWLPGSLTATYVLENEILDWAWKYPYNAQVGKETWLTAVPADTLEDAKLIAELSVRFEEGGTKNVGELHIIALAKRFGGTAIIEDQQARKAARSDEAKVKSVYMVSMIGAASACDLISENKAWDLQRQLEAGRERSVIRSVDSQAFREMVRLMKELRPRLPEWPECLHNNGLDLIAIAARNQELSTLRDRFGLPPRRTSKSSAKSQGG
jgi:predicted nucleic acid-binding protein